MKETDISLPAIEWVTRVNGSWIVRHGLAERAAEWLNYLGGQEDGRLEEACVRARVMCRRRGGSPDPKPWFYAGLFSVATAAEVRRFLGEHRLTPATVPSMWEDAEVMRWQETVGPETRELLARLRAEVEALSRPQ